jgi:hypothetical protein
VNKIESIVRPIVEGQIMSFLNDHPYIADAVRRQGRPGKSKRDWLKDSLAKRIVNDLACGISTARLRAALLAHASGGSPAADVETETASAAAEVASTTASAVEASDEALK